MEEQAFRLLTSQLERHFDEDAAFQQTWKDHAKSVEEKLDNLFVFKWKIIGSAALFSGLITLIINILLVYVSWKK
jgi:hypothetical protein